jgi:hypothetical protein
MYMSYIKTESSLTPARMNETPAASASVVFGVAENVVYFVAASALLISNVMLSLKYYLQKRTLLHASLLLLSVCFLFRLELEIIAYLGWCGSTHNIMNSNCFRVCIVLPYLGSATYGAVVLYRLSYFQWSLPAIKYIVPVMFLLNVVCLLCVGILISLSTDPDVLNVLFILNMIFASLSLMTNFSVNFWIGYLFYKCANRREAKDTEHRRRVKLFVVWVVLSLLSTKIFCGVGLAHGMLAFSLIYSEDKGRFAQTAGFFLTLHYTFEIAIQFTLSQLLDKTDQKKPEELAPDNVKSHLTTHPSPMAPEIVSSTGIPRVEIESQQISRVPGLSSNWDVTRQNASMGSNLKLGSQFVKESQILKVSP